MSRWKRRRQGPELSVVTFRCSYQAQDLDLEPLLELEEEDEGPRCAFGQHPVSVILCIQVSSRSQLRNRTSGL